MPPKVGQYSILSGTYYHGFHSLYSFLLPWSICNYAGVYATFKLYVGTKGRYAFQVLGYEKRDIFKKEGSSIASNGMLEGSAVH